jgi:hypothetical protein
MTYTSSDWEFAADTYLLKLQRLKDNFLHIIAIYSQVHENLCMQQAEVIVNHENEHVHSIGQGEARHRK